MTTPDTRAAIAQIIADHIKTFALPPYKAIVQEDVADSILAALPGLGYGRQEWREMVEAPEVEGAEIIACERTGGRPLRYRFQEKPHVIGKIEFPVERGWACKEAGVIIRRSYQERYLWVPPPELPAPPTAAHKEE